MNWSTKSRLNRLRRTRVEKNPAGALCNIVTNAIVSQQHRRDEIGTGLAVVAVSPLMLASARVIEFNQTVLDGPLRSASFRLVIADSLTVLGESEQVSNCDLPIYALNSS